jgi:hypothetical protein
MKKIQVLLFILGISIYSFGQITDTGDNVGIGTNSPQTKLHVKKVSSISDVSKTPNIGLLNLSLRTSDGFIPANTEGRLQFNFESWSNGDDTKGVIGFQIPENSNGWYGGSTLNFYTKAPAPGGGVSPGLINSFSIDRFGNATLRTVRSGTTSIPLNNTGLKLQYHTTGMHVPYGSENRISFTTKSYNNGESEIGAIAVKVGPEESGSYGGGEIVFYTKDSSPGGGESGEGLLERLRIDCKGRVGIGTENTGNHKLAVEGSIGAREIQVEANGWSDFVFEDNYELKSLEETEQFIKENKHLPDVPNESEVLEKGINLGEMDSKLLQKIEELTLYMIEMNKELKNVKEKNLALEEEIRTLKGE